MSQIDYGRVFNCPRCGIQGSIYVLKVSGALIIIKQRCPQHGGRAFKVPLSQRNLYLDEIRKGIHRCHKCAQETTIDSVKMSGPWTLIRGFCKIHKNKLPIQKIWTYIFNEVSANAPTETVAPSETITPATLVTPDVTPTFCSACGSSLEGKEKFCGVCGELVK